jgi:1-deoxy-D-xylulose-5-phosphate synthase
VTRFDPERGPGGDSSGSRPTYTQVFTGALLDAAKEDERIHAITAAMPGSTGLLAFEARFPDRFHDVGIAEQHAVGTAAGMAMAGLRPVVAIFSTFFCRAVDQLVNDVCLHRLPVVFCIDRAGITGSDGPSHHGFLDLAIATKIPGLTVFAPSSGPELRSMLGEALRNEAGPSLIRFPKGAAAETPPGSGLAARRLRRGADGCIVAAGRLVRAAEDAADLLADDGWSVSVWDVRVATPLDDRMVRDASAHPLVVTVEEGIRIGGVGSLVAERMAALHSACRLPALVHLGTPFRYLPQGDPDAILSDLGLDAEGIAGATRPVLRALANGDVRLEPLAAGKERLVRA